MSTFTAAAATDRSLIFTFAPESTVPADFPERVEAAMTAAGGRVRFVELRVSDAEQEKRIDNPDRTEAGKLASLATLRAIRRQDEVTPGGFTPWRADMVIDTDASDAESSARVIRDAFGLSAVAPHEPYPEPFSDGCAV